MYLKSCAFCDNLIAPGLKVCLSHMSIEIDGVNIPYAVYKEYEWFQMLAAAEQVQYHEEKTKINISLGNTSMRRAQSDGRKEKILNMFYIGGRKPKEIARLLSLNVYAVWKVLERYRKRKNPVTEG